MTIISAFTGVFDAVFTWLTTALQTVLGLFYTTEGLTILGTMLVISLAISVFFLLVGVISNFFHFRA